MRDFLDLLSRPGRGPVAGLAFLVLLRGLLPTLIIVLTGLLVDAVPAAVEAGVDGLLTSRAFLWLSILAGAFVLSGAADALATFAGRAVGSRYAITAHDATAAAALAPAGIAELERPEVAAELAAVDEYERADLYRDAVQQLSALTALRLQGVAAFVLLLGFRWWAPLVMLVGWRLVNRSVVSWIEKGVALGHAESGSGLRRAQYYRSLAVDSPTAKEVRVFGLADWVVGRYAAVWHDAMGRIWRGRKASWTGVVLTAGGLAAAFCVVLGALGQAALAGDVTVGSVVIFAQAALATAMLGPLGDVQWRAGRILHAAHRVVDLENRLEARRSAVAGTPRADALLEAGSPSPPGDTSGEPASSSSPRPVAVSFSDVHFSYPGGSEPVLSGLDLTIPAGQSLAVVGENGSGKTTLLKLLCGLYRPDAGTVTVDGCTDPVEARQRLGIIFQDFVRYELPLSANVGYGDLALAGDADQLGAALRDAGGADLLDLLPAGWDSVLARGYENGADLSGGQWQKVALARALTAVRGGAGLLILDEPTANLDVRTETELFERFLAITRGVTTLLVSHRLSSVRRAQRIVVLADGGIVEDGSHEELMHLGGRYAHMYTLQADRFTAGGETEKESPGA